MRDVPKPCCADQEKAILRTRAHWRELAEARAVWVCGLGDEGQVMRTRRTVRARVEVLR